MTVHLFALSSQGTHVDEVLASLKSKDLAVEARFTDLNTDAQELLTKHNLTIQPVLFDISHVEGQDVLTKFAEGSAVLSLTDEQVVAVKAALAVVTTPPAE